MNILMFLELVLEFFDKKMALGRIIARTHLLTQSTQYSIML